MAEKDETIKEKEETIKEKDETIKEKEDAVSKKENELMKYIEKFNQEKEEWLGELDGKSEAMREATFTN